MSKTGRYPSIKLRSKNELAKRISGKELDFKQALALINDAIYNFDKYWYDSKRSEPEKGKYVRSAVGNSLGKLLKFIDRKILAPYDFMVPEFIFGGLSGKNHIQAAYYLLGKQRYRSSIKLDVRSFFEQIHEDRVTNFFNGKCNCSRKASQLIARLCCVPIGPKVNPGTVKSLARGFSTSPRLSLWCNLDLFERLNWKVKRSLRGHDPRLMIFVDDIGITASRVSTEKMESIASFVENILLNFDDKQPLPINPTKKKIASYKTGIEILGTRLGRNKLTMGAKSHSKMNLINNALAKATSMAQKKLLLSKHRAYHIYKKQLRDITKNNTAIDRTSNIT